MCWHNIQRSIFQCSLLPKTGIPTQMLTNTIKKYEESDSYNYNDVWAVLSGIATIILIIIGLLISIEQIFDIATCLTFPEKIVIEELKMIHKSM